MKLRACLATAVLVLATGCGGDGELPSPEPGGETTGSETGGQAGGEVGQESLVVAPGSIGPVRVGMTVEEANATGYFEPHEERTDGRCKDDHAPIQWKDPYTDSLTVWVEKGAITSLGVSEGPETAEGVGVGSTYEEVLIAYPGAKARRGEVLGSTIYLTDGDQWLGIGFEPEIEKLTDSSEVQYMETTVGSRPGAFRADCV